MQFSLKHIFAVTTFFAVMCSALIYASALWASIVFTVCALLLLTSLVLSWASRGPWRGFWIGFAIFGWGYWAVLHSPILDFDPDTPNWRMGQQDPPLITNAFLYWVYSYVLPLVHEQPQFDLAGNITNDTRYPLGPDFMKVGHSIFSLLFAMVGGMVGMAAYRRSRRDSDAKPVK